MTKKKNLTLKLFGKTYSLPHRAHSDRFAQDTWKLEKGPLYIFVERSEGDWSMSLAMGDFCWWDEYRYFSSKEEMVAEVEKEILEQWTIMAEFMGYEVEG